jgi:ribosomal 50S subunit-recycling heat shock protein
MTGQDEALQAQRLDRWLWYARIFKTRTLAAKFVQDGHVRVTTNQATVRAEKPSFTIRIGDTLVFTRGEQLRILEISRWRRGAAPHPKHKRSMRTNRRRARQKKSGPSRLSLAKKAPGGRQRKTAANSKP